MFFLRTLAAVEEQAGELSEGEGRPG